MATIDPVTFVLVDLTIVPAAGQDSLLIRLNGEDGDAIRTAASIMGMRIGEFLRAASVNAAKKVITENAR